MSDSETGRPAARPARGYRRRRLSHLRALVPSTVLAGLYGVSSYVVAMRSREIAIRMAVGATPRAVLMMVLVQSMRVAVIGLLFGAGAAVVVSRLIQAGYHGIQGIDGVAFGGAAALFLAAMLLASAIPAVRASRMDPVENLKDA